MRALASSLTLVLAALWAVGCSAQTRTTELTEIDAPGAYGWSGDAAGSRADTLFIVTASGGGTRAAALTLGALRGLEGVALAGGGRTLLDEVDLISSVSGGSVTAAYFAHAGADGFDQLEREFIRNDGIAEIILRAINPVTLAKLQTTAYSRLDVLVDYLRDSLFEGATYEELIGGRPYLILNAADMSGGSVFSFTQSRFDLICADLARLTLAEAVAASAAFPVALAPLTMKSYSPCAAQWVRYEELTGAPGATNRERRWPPIWLQNAVRDSIDSSPARSRRGRRALPYLNIDCDFEAHPVECEPVPAGERKDFVHLLDGGIADNLGLTEPLRLITTADVSPRLFRWITQGDIKNLVFVMVNASSAADSDIGQSDATPGMMRMLSSTIGSAIDGTTFAMIDQLQTVVKELLRLAGQKLPDDLAQNLDEIGRAHV